MTSTFTETFRLLATYQRDPRIEPAGVHDRRPQHSRVLGALGASLDVQGRGHRFTGRVLIAVIIVVWEFVIKFSTTTRGVHRVRGSD